MGDECTIRFRQYGQAFTAGFCTADEAAAFTALHTPPDDCDPAGYFTVHDGPEPDAEYVDLGHAHCYGKSCPQDAQANEGCGYASASGVVRLDTAEGAGDA